MNLCHWLILGPSFYFLHFVFFFWHGDTSGRKLYYSFSQKCLWRQTPKVGKKRWVLGYSKTCTQSVIVSYSKKSVSNNAPLSATYSGRWSNYVIKHKFSLGTNNACARKVKPSFFVCIWIQSEATFVWKCFCLSTCLIGIAWRFSFPENN